MSIYIKVVCIYISAQYIHQSHLYSSQRPWYFQNGVAASARADRRHTAAIRPSWIEVAGCQVWRFDSPAPKQKGRRGSSMETNGRPVNVASILSSQQTSHIVRRGTCLPMCLSSLLFFWKCLQCHWKHFNKKCLQSISRKSSPRAAAQQLAKSITWAICIWVPASSKSSF